MVSATSRADGAGLMDLHSDVKSTLGRFDHRDPAQMQRAQEYHDFVRYYDDCLWQTSAVGHITASALVIDARTRSVLLTLHPKVGRWLQLGGHLERGDVSLRDGAAREVIEECGVAEAEISALPIRLDRHPVPCGRAADGSPHRSEHWDVQYVVRVDGMFPFRMSSESDDLRWVAIEDLADIEPPLDESVMALIEDACRALTEPTGWVTIG
jgi:8-oxo-dGTP pyrophosphatase MutT (NUDIX family)